MVAKAAILEFFERFRHVMLSVYRFGDDAIVTTVTSSSSVGRDGMSQKFPASFSDTLR